MKAKYDFEFMNLDDGLVAVPVGNDAAKFRGVLKINETAEKIIRLLANETTEEQIVDTILKEYNGEKEKISGYVHEFISKLIQEGIVE